MMMTVFIYYESKSLLGHNQNRAPDKMGSSVNRLVVVVVSLLLEFEDNAAKGLRNI